MLRRNFLQGCLCAKCVCIGLKARPLGSESKEGNREQCIIVPQRGRQTEENRNINLLLYKHLCNLNNCFLKGISMFPEEQRNNASGLCIMHPAYFNYDWSGLWRDLSYWRCKAINCKQRVTFLAIFGDCSSRSLADGREIRDCLHEDLLSSVRLKLSLGLLFTKLECCKLQLEIFPNMVFTSRF